MNRHLAVIPILLGLVALLAGPASAQSPLELSPTQLTLNGVRGQSLARTLMIQARDDLTGLQVVAGELANEHGDVVTPAVGPDGPALPADIPADTVVQLPLTFDLRGLPAGTYTGELLIAYEGGSRPVPVRLGVKTQPWLPLVALVGGVALGVGVSGYRAKGRPRDEVMVRLGQIRTQMKVDEELATLGQPFRNRIEADLVDVEGALEAQQWPQAQAAAERAARIWTGWRRYRPDWIVQLTAYHAYLDWLTNLAPGSRYITELAEAAADHLRGAPDLDGPQAFRDGLEALRDRANAFAALLGKVERLAALGAAGAAQAAAYREQLESLSSAASDVTQRLATLSERVALATDRLRKAELNALLARYRDLQGDAEGTDVAAYEARIEALTPEADAEYVTLRIDLLAALAAARSGGEPDGAKGGAERFTEAVDVAAGTPALMRVLPQVRVQTLEASALAAGRRLRWFTWLTYGITVVLLALAGFVELYGARVDFGANGVGDFFALLAWGFGAEATRSAISEMVQSWGIVRQ